MNVLALGASRNIGYYAALRLLRQGATVTFLLRKTSVFDDDAQIQPYIKSNKARLVSGDALVADDVKKVWLASLEAGQGKIDCVLFSIGLLVTFSISKGIHLPTPNVCTQALLNLLSTMPDALRAPDTQPRFVAITSNGITSESHKAVPLVVKPVYSLLLPAAHADKLGMEHVLAYVAGLHWDSKDEPPAGILPEGWQATPGLPGPGELKHVVIIRPTLLTDGECRGDKADDSGKAPYRAAKDTTLPSGYRVSRQDTAHFIVEDVLQNWSQWEGSGVCLAY